MTHDHEEGVHHDDPHLEGDTVTQQALPLSISPASTLPVDSSPSGLGSPSIHRNNHYYRGRLKSHPVQILHRALVSKMVQTLSRAQSYWLDAAHSRMALVKEASSSNNPTGALSLVDDEITSMLEAIRAMRTFRNTLSPLASKLLPELLAYIFGLCMEGVPPNISTKIMWARDKTRVHPSWIPLTQVCQHWRIVALQTPALWANLAGEYGDRWLWEMVERSKTAPVTFTSITSAFDKSVLSTIMHRVRSISIVSEEHGFEDIMGALKTPAPLLEYLDISKHGIRSDVFNRSLPPDVFAGVAPNLRGLHLGACTFPLITPISPILLCLTHLKVSSHGKPKQMIPTPAEATFHSHLFSALPLMGNLENLTLIYCLPHSARIQSHIPGSILPLAKLKNLALHDDTADCGSFLSYLRIPSGTQVTLHLDTCYYHDVSIVHASESMIAALRLQPIIRQSFQTLMISLTPSKPPIDAKLGMFAWKDFVYPASSPDFAIYFEGSFLGGSQSRLSESLTLIQAICGVLPFEDVRSVYFNEQPCDGETQLLIPIGSENAQFGTTFSSAVFQASVDICKGFTQLETIQVGTRTQLSALMTTLSLSETEESFPGLRTLALVGLDFSSPDASESGGSLGQEADNLLGMLSSCFRQRKALNAEIKLHIKDCLIPEKWAQCLEQETEVVWHHQEDPPQLISGN
ncbi:hypothetical protein EVG20_g3017 [Dentipellis fragilis]|uniref:Uncharacterized protein n=1 Tax=Dentipellis fragilis TaxID=205917 RepID=A0A4Y9Z7B3_9AGAM|nr:hypothetical protein EVG20_g3017 [Dentipellis fragilis]